MGLVEQAAKPRVPSPADVLSNATEPISPADVQTQVVRRRIVKPPVEDPFLTLISKAFGLSKVEANRIIPNDPNVVIPLAKVLKPE